jgi:hypothetical protein
VRVQTAGSAVAMTSGGAVTPARRPARRRSGDRRQLRAPTADRPAPANSAAYTKGTSHRRGGCRAPASGFTNAQHMARDRAPPRLAVCEDGEWRDRGPRLLSPQRPRSFHCQASVSEHGPSGRHPRASGCHPRESGNPAVVRLVRGATAVRAVLPLPPGEGGLRVQTVAAAGRTHSDASIPHPSTATNSAMIRKSAEASRARTIGSLQTSS